MDPAVMRMALMILIALGCSDVMYSRAVAAFNNHAGASALVVTTDGEVSTTILEPPNKGMAYLRHCLHETVLVTVSSIRCASSTSRSPCRIWPSGVQVVEEQSCRLALSCQARNQTRLLI